MFLQEKGKPNPELEDQLLLHIKLHFLLEYNNKAISYFM